MAQCNILEALRYVEDLYTSASNDKSNAANKKALLYLFEDINEQRAQIQQIASLANVKPLDISVPREVVPSLRSSLEVAKESYKEFGTKLVEFIKSKKEVTVELNKTLAMRILKDPMTSFARFTVDGPNKGTIKYPDFSAMLKDTKSMQNLAKSLGMSFLDLQEIALEHRTGRFMEMTKVHEHIHAGSMEFMAENPKDPKTVYVNNLYKKMLNLAETERPSLNDVQNGYWKENVDEFLAVALSNPDLMAFLDDMPATGFTSTLHKLVNTLARMVGIKQGSENEALLNIFLEMTESNAEKDSKPNTSTSAAQMGLFQGIPSGELNDIIEKVIKCRAEG
jgi:hypothetical protein